MAASIPKPQVFIAEPATPHTVPEALQDLAAVVSELPVEEIQTFTNAELIHEIANAMVAILNRIHALEQKLEQK